MGGAARRVRACTETRTAAPAAAPAGGDRHRLTPTAAPPEAGWPGPGGVPRLHSNLHRNRQRTPPPLRPSDCPHALKGEPEQKESAAAEPVIPPTLDTPASRAAWSRWEWHPREIRHPLNPSSREAQLKKLARYGEAVALAAIQESIEQGWQGLFPEKVAPAGPTSSPPDDEAPLSRDELLARQRQQQLPHREALKGQAGRNGDGAPAPKRQKGGW